MKNKIVATFICLLSTFAARAPINSEAVENFSLRMLSGQWEGRGRAVIPKISIPVSVKGKALFSYDTLTHRLRTSLEASRFFFTYADSGYLSHDPATDSILWEVWDGFGKYLRYEGKIEGNVITGSVDRGGRYNRIAIDFIDSDSLSFSLTTIYKDGEVRERAAIDMWRVK